MCESEYKPHTKSATADAHRAHNAPTEPQGRAQTEGKTPRQSRKVRRKPNAKRPDRVAARPRANRGKPPRQSRKAARKPRAKRPDKPQKQTRAECRTSRQPESTCRGVPEFRITPAVSPRAQSPVPALKPARRSLSPAHNSLSHETEYRFDASARTAICRRPDLPFTRRSHTQ